MERINELKGKVFHTALKHGWYDEKTTLVKEVMLIISELGEAINADRKGHYAQKGMFMRHSATPQPEPERHWNFCFELFIKDTVEDELADAVIRILSYAGYIKVDLSNIGLTEEAVLKSVEYISSIPRKRELTFPEELYIATDDLLATVRGTASMGEVLLDLFVLAKRKNIDLLWFVEQKMKYNESRPYKHGKIY